MKAVGVIPARWASTRFAGKVLADIAGKPMIQRVWERAQKSRLLSEVIIACDDERVLCAAAGFKARAVMTAATHRCGTDRIIEAMQAVPADIVVNIQGDEPLVDPGAIDAVVRCLIDDTSAVMSTAVKRCADKQAIEAANIVKVVIDQTGTALYFSRALIPFRRADSAVKDPVWFTHVGLYAYRREFLLRFQELPKSYLEDVEQLEQLRALEAGYKIKTVEVQSNSIGVDTPEDVQRVIELINRNAQK